MDGDELLAEEGLLIERLADDAGYFLRGGRLLERLRTPHQEIEVWDTPRFGRLFRLDGCFMTSECDEFHYHENLAHVAGVAHPCPRRTLVLGGGDGGSAEELLKHPSIDRVVVVELDAGVVDIARRHLQAVHRGALDDPRVELRIGDGMAHVEAMRGQPAADAFDLIVFDLTDPVGAAKPLFSAAFFGACRALLAPGGTLSLQLGSAYFQRDQVASVLRELRTAFGVVRPYLAYVPLYGSLCVFAVASDTLDPAALGAGEVDARIAARRLEGLRHYNGAVHCAQFAYPNHLRGLLA
ncbi:polyamine aminopropyltransferase [Thauera sinica]|uniref:Polyamine aminopropyltransferase n=1 Tax=Thauera sinica TaxID=2665146 RepID=A0ABW1ATN4_9RHOO|nr:polyamine aminopropyltransferase [Thauera sp. K11]ATE61928.1 polyamine aminopropyltransferase [Thauera sp. K11]